MKLNRTIKLTKQIRADIVDTIMSSWAFEHPRPEVSRLPTADQMQALDQWRKDRDAYHKRLVATLDTFRSVNELIELWPTAQQFIPLYVLNPEANFALPKQVA